MWSWRYQVSPLPELEDSEQAHVPDLFRRCQMNANILLFPT